MNRKSTRKVLGPVTDVELATIGITDRSTVKKLGWEEVFVRWVDAYPERLNLNAAVGLIAVELEISWLDVSTAYKERARVLIERMRCERGLTVSSRR